MTFNETYFALIGLAHIKGIDHFGDIMPKSRVRKLFYACLESKGFAWVQNEFAHWIIAAAHHKHE